MKKNIKKLQLKKRTITHLDLSAQQLLNGGLKGPTSLVPVCPPTVRFCPTPPESRDCTPGND